MNAYLEMQQQGIDVVTQNQAFDPEQEYYLNGQRIDDGSYDPTPDAEPDFDAIDEYAQQTYQDGEEEGDAGDDEYVDIWEDVIPHDPETWPHPDDVVDQLKELTEVFEPDAEGMREFRAIADYAEGQGDYEFTCVCRAIQQVYAGNLSIPQAYNKVVSDIGKQEALRIWVDLQANGLLPF